MIIKVLKSNINRISVKYDKIGSRGRKPKLDRNRQKVNKLRNNKLTLTKLFKYIKSIDNKNRITVDIRKRLKEDFKDKTRDYNDNQLELYATALVQSARFDSRNTIKLKDIELVDYLFKIYDVFKSEDYDVLPLGPYKQPIKRKIDRKEYTEVEKQYMYLLRQRPRLIDIDNNDHLDNKKHKKLIDGVHNVVYAFVYKKE